MEDEQGSIVQRSEVVPSETNVPQQQVGLNSVRFD